MIGVRFGYHDLEDLQKGLPEGALIELADLGFSIHQEDNRHTLMGEKFKLVEIGSYPDYTQWSNKTSFYFKWGFERNTDKICSDCVNGQLSFGAGLTKSNQNFRFSLLPVISYKHGDFQNENFESFYNFLQMYSKAILEIDFNDNLQIRLENNYSLLNSEKVTMNEFTEILRINTTKSISFEMSLHQNEIQNFGAFSFYYYTF